jgi:hypothetical protein
VSSPKIARRARYVAIAYSCFGIHRLPKPGE